MNSEPFERFTAEIKKQIERNARAHASEDSARNHPERFLYIAQEQLGQAFKALVDRDPRKVETEIVETAAVLFEAWRSMEVFLDACDSIYEDFLSGAVLGHDESGRLTVNPGNNPGNS